MHSRAYLRDADFMIRSGPEPRSGGVHPLQGRWQAGDRVAFVAPDARTGIQGCGAAVLLLTHWFYRRAAARQPGFFDYPQHYAIIGERGAATRHLGPDEQRPWGAAWCWLDVWPATHHLVAEPTAEALLLAVLTVEPQWLFWPASLPAPGPLRSADGADDRALRSILAARLQGVIVYGGEAPAAGPAWSIELCGGAATLFTQSLEILAAADADAARSPGSVWSWPVAVGDFLGIA